MPCWCGAYPEFHGVTLIDPPTRLVAPQNEVHVWQVVVPDGYLCGERLLPVVGRGRSSDSAAFSTAVTV